MPRLRWTRDGVRFTDHARNFTATAGEYEFEDDERVEEYLSHQSGGWERVDETSDTSSETDAFGDDSAEEFEQAMDDVEAATDPDTAADDADDESGYTRDELEAMEYGELQTLAADADTDEINGRSSRDDIVEALSDE